MLNKIPNHHTTATLLANLGFRSAILFMFGRNYFGQLDFARVMKIFKSFFLFFHQPRLTAMSSSCSSDVSSGAMNFMYSIVLISNPSVTISAKLEFWRRHFKVFLSNAFLDTGKESHLQRAILWIDGLQEVSIERISVDVNFDTGFWKIPRMNIDNFANTYIVALFSRTSFYNRIRLLFFV